MTSFPMTEVQIECAVARKIDRLDEAFMQGHFNQAEYNRQMHDINQWAEFEYRLRQR